MLTYSKEMFTIRKKCSRLEFVSWSLRKKFMHSVKSSRGFKITAVKNMHNSEKCSLASKNIHSGGLNVCGFDKVYIQRVENNVQGFKQYSKNL